MIKLFQMRCLPRWAMPVVCALTLLQACDIKAYISPQGYDLRKGEANELGKSLNEISGISFNAADSTLWAISDSKRNIVLIDLKTGKLKDITKNIIEPDQDLEDIVKMDTAAYLLSSKGLIYEVSLNTIDSPVVRSYPLWDSGKNDFETLYYDPASSGLIMLCKDCESDKGKKIRSAYRFDLKTKQFDSSAYFTVATDEVRKLAKNDDAKFEPSAAAVNPVNNRLYILSSAGNLLVITDSRGKVLEVYHLNPDKHPQAEGIAFAQNGDMYITNEGKYGKPTLQVFKYQKAKNQ